MRPDFKEGVPLAAAALFTAGIAFGQPTIAGAQEKTTKCEAPFRIGSLPNGQPARVRVVDSTTMALYSSDVRKVGDRFAVVGFTSNGKQSSIVTASTSGSPDSAIDFRFQCIDPENRNGKAKVYTLYFGELDLSVTSTLESIQSSSDSLPATPTPLTVNPAESRSEEGKSGDPLDPYYKYILGGLGVLFVVRKTMNLLWRMGFRIRIRFNRYE